MTRFQGEDTTVLAGHGFDQNGPFLRVNNLATGEIVRFPVRGKTFSLRPLPKRWCTGRYDLQTHQRQACPLRVELLADSKDTMCPACIEATGFNPSFYYADRISPQQRAYNLTPHFVYLAYFSPQHVKAGISAESRGIARLLEQGARSACIVGRFANADKARALEAALCEQQGVLETMRASLKTRLLVEERFDPTQAAQVLEEAAKRLATVPEVAAAGFVPEEVQNLSPHYFGGLSPDTNDMQLADNAQTSGTADECAGRCVGMVGGALVFEQGGMNFVKYVGEWESHEIDILEDEVTCVYEAEPMQFSLF